MAVVTAPGEPVELTDDHGAKRVRLDEDVWAYAVASAGIVLPPGAAPLEGHAPRRVQLGRGLRAATRLLASAPVRVSISVASADGEVPGLTSLLVTDGRVGVRLLRRLPPGVPGELMTGEGGARVHLVPGVEVSAFHAGALPGETIGLLPPAPGTWDPEDVAVTLPIEAAVMFQRELDAEIMAPSPEHDATAEHPSRLERLLALHDQDQALVPRVLTSLEHLRSDAVMSVAGGRPPGTQHLARLVCGSVGWVHLSLRDDGVLHEPLDRRGCEALVASAVSGELARVLSAGGPRADAGGGAAP